MTVTNNTGIKEQEPAETDRQLSKRFRVEVVVQKTYQKEICILNGADLTQEVSYMLPFLEKDWSVIQQELLGIHVVENGT